MIGGHEIDYPFAKPLPERFSVLAIANRRRTFIQGRSCRYFFRTQMKVVRAGLHRDVKSSALGVSESRQRLGTRKVHDVDPASNLLAQSDQQVDRAEFRFVWPRFKICLVQTPVR